MKIIDVYNDYKEKYNNYVIFIKSGIFYEVYNEDVSVIYTLFKYKIKNNGDNFVIGFPIKSIIKNCSVLEKNKINYIILEKNDDGIFTEYDKYKSNKNNYSNYLIDLNKLQYISYRINKINDKLNDMILDDNIENILKNIEDII